MNGVDAALALVVSLTAFWTIRVRAAFIAVAAYTGCGLLIALVWVRLRAVDVALTEAAIGAGVTGAVLIAAAARLRPAEEAANAERPARRLRAVAAALSVTVALALAVLVLLPADPAPSLGREAVAPLDDLGLGNPVTAVLMVYRGMDTLLEKLVLLLAVIGVWSLAPDRFWGGAPAAPAIAGRNGPLLLAARLLPPIGIVFAIYTVWTGASAPGGAFQGGAVLAAMWMLVLAAGLARIPAVTNRCLRLLLAAGPATFMAIALAGFLIAGAFLAYPPGLAKALIVLAEIPMVLTIALVLALLAAGPPAGEPER